MTGRKRQEKRGNREDDEEQAERMQQPRPKIPTTGTKKIPKNVKGKGIVETAEQSDNHSEDGFMDRPITSIIRRIIKEGKESRKEVRSKNVHDRPQKKPKQNKVEVPTDTTSKKRKAPKSIDDETAGRNSRIAKDCRRSKLFAAYLQGRGYTELARKVGGMVHDTLHLSWAQEDNEKDCAIYVMRHMETFMGKTGREWKHGIVPSSTNQLKYMRARYCAAIATSEVNELRQTVIDNATKYCSDLTKKRKGKIDFESELINWK